jgi:protein phosphatase PTC7
VVRRISVKNSNKTGKKTEKKKRKKKVYIFFFAVCQVAVELLLSGRRHANQVAVAQQQHFLVRKAKTVFYFLFNLRIASHRFAFTRALSSADLLAAGGADDDTDAQSLPESPQRVDASSLSSRGSGLLRASSSKSAAAHSKAAAQAKALAAARQSLLQSRELSQDELTSLTDHAKERDVDRWVNGRPLLLPVVNAGPLARSGSPIADEADADGSGSPGVSRRSSLNPASPAAPAQQIASPSSFEELPAKRSSTVLERGSKTGPYVHAGLVNLSPISPHAKFAESSASGRRRTSIFSSARKQKVGWDGLERICTKHYHQNEELVEHLLRGARDGVCVCCQLPTTKSPTFFALQPDGTLPATEDGAQAERDAAAAAEKASKKGKKSGKSGKSGAGKDKSGGAPVADVPRVRLVLPMPRGDRPSAPCELQLCAAHWERNSTVVGETRLDSADLAADEDLVFESSCCLIPHPQKQKSEDAFFIAASSRAIGVCDGVGGWASLGVDPSAYSTRLTKEMRAYVDRGGHPGAHEVLHHGWCVTQAARVQGSTTACVLTLDGDNLVNTVNVGDSGFLVFRDGFLVYASDPQQHAPNTPFQLGTDSVDTPYDGNVARLKLRIGDLIVVGSDGLFDNLYTDEILSLVNEQGTVDEIATRLSQRASVRANDTNYLSPFATYIRALGKYPDWTGGKLDDITTVVARVGKMSKAARQAEQARLLSLMQNMLGGEESLALDCEVCGFRFKTPELRRMHIAQWHADSNGNVNGKHGNSGNANGDDDDDNEDDDVDDTDDADDERATAPAPAPKPKSKLPRASLRGSAKRCASDDEDDDTRTCLSEDEADAAAAAAAAAATAKKPAPAATPAAAAGDARKVLQMPPFGQRVIAIPFWPVTGGSEKSYVEFQRAQAELELWENGVLRERLLAQQEARRAMFQQNALRDPSTNDLEERPQMINNAIAGTMQRRMQKPQSLRSDYVILPYSWSVI